MHLKTRKSKASSFEVTSLAETSARLPLQPETLTSTTAPPKPLNPGPPNSKL